MSSLKDETDPAESILSMIVLVILFVVTAIVIIVVDVYGCGGTNNGQNGANDESDTVTTLDGTSDQGCYGCILDVGVISDSSPLMGEDKGEGETVNGDANISSGCQKDNDCLDEIDCTADTCLPNGTCQSLPDDSKCGQGEVCDLEHNGCFKAKSCFNDEQCDDGVDCTVEGCNTETKLCYPAIKDNARCEGGFVCLPEHPEAEAASGCVFGSHCEEDADCVAGVSCASGQCLLGVCEWTPDDAACDDNNICNGSEICDPIKGCQSINPLVCDDQIACTKDDCEPDEGCTHIFNDVECTKECATLCTVIILCAPDYAINDCVSFCEDMVKKNPSVYLILLECVESSNDDCTQIADCGGG